MVLKKKIQRIGNEDDKVLVDTLHILCSQIEAHAKFSRKVAFKVSELKAKLRQAPCQGIKKMNVLFAIIMFLKIGKFVQHVELLAKYAPEWITLVQGEFGKVVRISAGLPFSTILKRLRKMKNNINDENVRTVKETNSEAV